LIILAFGVREFHATKNGAMNGAGLHRFEARTIASDGGRYLQHYMDGRAAEGRSGFSHSEI
jgi:hypothetical protein